MYTSIEFKLIKYTSARHKEINTIDYFLFFKDKTIAKAIYYFEQNGIIYLLAESYNIEKEYAHIKEIKCSGYYFVKRADEITDKLIYISYKYGINSIKEFVSLRPNRIEKT